MKKDGFIATSLIYSFFLVFIAIMAVLISNYIANKTILLRFNEDILDKKNGDVFTVNFVTHGSENYRIEYEEVDFAGGEKKLREKVLLKGQTLTNLIQDSQFKNDEKRWVGSLGFSVDSVYDGKSGAYVNNSTPSSYIRQDNIMSTNNDKYYFSIEYASNASYNFQAFMNNTSNAKLDLSPNDLKWQRVGKTFRELGTTGPSNSMFIQNTGVSSGSYGNQLYFTNAMLIDLTSHYGAGKEPELDWIDENVPYFEGTINLLKVDNLRKNDEVIIKMVTTKSNYDKIESLNCWGVNGKWENIPENITLEIEEDTETPLENSEDKKYYGILRLKNISDNINCDLEWLPV